MKKTFEEIGPNGTFKGFVEIKEISLTKTGTHSVTHDDYVYQVTKYLINANLITEDDSRYVLLYSSFTLDQNEILKIVEHVENVLNTELSTLANRKTHPSYKTQLKSNGYFK